MVDLKRGSALVLLFCCGFPAAAQELSYDGNRWYDVELSIFTNEVPGGTRSEVPVARKLTAAYLPRLRELQTRSSAFLVDFPADRPPELAPAVIPALPAPLPVVPETPPVQMGPIYSPAVRDGFKITDFERDPFVDLDTRAAQFGPMNRSIEAAPDHRLLWHKAWRQPIHGRAQTEAVFVAGGELRGEHYELEGSLRVVDNAGRAMLDINIWLNEFTPGPVVAAAAEAAEAAAATEGDAEWTLPPLPFPPEQSPNVAAPAQWTLSAVWQLAQTRELSANQLYYLDHPAVGVLIQVRPYVLPPLVGSDAAADF